MTASFWNVRDARGIYNSSGETRSKMDCDLMLLGKGPLSVSAKWGGQRVNVAKLIKKSTLAGKDVISERPAGLEWWASKCGAQLERSVLSCCCRLLSLSRLRRRSCELSLRGWMVCSSNGRAELTQMAAFMAKIIPRCVSLFAFLNVLTLTFFLCCLFR